MRYSSPSRVFLKILRFAAIGCYIIFALLPLFWLVKISVTPTKLLYSEGVRLWPSSSTWENFRSVIYETEFLTFFQNSLIVSLSTALITTLLSASAGYAFSRFRFKGKAAIVIIMMITQMFPLLMIIAPIYKLFLSVQNALSYAIIPVFDHIEAWLPFLEDHLPDEIKLIDTLAGLVLIYVAFNLPFATFLMQSFFDGIPKDLEESAMIDGCTRFQAFRKIVFPLTLPGVAATLGFVFTAAWSELLFALMLVNSKSTMTFPVGLLNFVSKFGVDWGQMMAAGVLALIPSCIFFLLIQRYLVQGMTSGSVKG